MLVSELMNRHAVTVSPDESARHASKLLCRYNIGSIPVIASDGRLRGIVTDRDITLRCTAAENDPDDTPVSEIMTRSVMTVAPDEEIHEAAQKMASGQIRRLPVVANGKLVGIVSLADIARKRQTLVEAGAALSMISGNIRRT